MTQKFWQRVAEHITAIIEAGESQLNAGQEASLRCLAGRLPQHGMIIVDEVGMGKPASRRWWPGLSRKRAVGWPSSYRRD